MNLLVEYLLKLVGTPYRFGGNSPVGGIDCSGLALETLRSFGLSLGDMNAQELHAWCKAQGCYPLRQPGALSFYGSLGSISHVGVVINKDFMIEAGGGNHTVLTVKDASEKNAYVRIRPIEYRKDFIDVLMPKYPYPLSL